MVRFIKGIFNHEPDNISLNFIAGYRFFKAIEVAKLCKNFVLLELKTAFKHSPEEHDTVKNLIQELIDQIIDPDTFRRRLREAFNFKDFLQLYHFAFLENHVTELRKSLMSGQISINGIISPANNVTQQKPMMASSMNKNNSANTSQAKASSGSGKRTETTSKTGSNNSIDTQIQHLPMVNYRKPLFDQSNANGKFDLSSISKTEVSLLFFHRSKAYSSNTPKYHKSSHKAITTNKFIPDA